MTSKQYDPRTGQIDDSIIMGMNQKIKTKIPNKHKLQKYKDKNVE